MVAAILLVAQVAVVETVATCRVPSDPQQRVWMLERRDAGASASWQIAFSAKSLDKPRVELPLPTAAPITALDGIRLSYKSADGGPTIEWRIAGGASLLDLYVNHGLEVNVEADLDPAVGLMNTEGPVGVECDGAGSREPGTGSREWMVAAGAARSVRLFESTSGRAYAVQTIAWGRELTPDWGPGILRGRFVWAVEATPLFAQFSPDAIYGVGVAPLVWRWNFVPQPRWSAFAELAMGGLWTTDPIPEETGRANFTAHWGGGVRLLPRGRHALLVAYRFQHFSNGNQMRSNPGVNSHVVLIGWSYRS